MTGAGFGILGPLKVEVGGASVELAGPKPRALLALLLISANRRVSADRLADDLWEGRPPASAGATLQVYVSRLCKVLGSGARIVTWHGGYSIEVDPVAIDAVRFERAVDRAAQETRRGARPSAARLAKESQELADPLRERLWAGLMLALYRSGRQSDALRAFQRLRRHLAEELGIEPGEQLGHLEECILLHKPELDWIPPPASPAPADPNAGADPPDHGDDSLAPSNAVGFGTP